MASTELMQVMDGVLQAQTSALQASWTAGSTLRLFTDDRDPTPEDETTDFTEPVHSEYAEVDLTGKWSSPFRDMPGVWNTHTETVSFLAPTSGSAVTVHGYFVVKDGDVLIASRFASPVELTVGGAAFAFSVDFNLFSGVVHGQQVCT